MLHVMELADVSFFGNKFKQMMQKSASSSDGGDAFAFERLAGGVAFFGVAFFGVAFFGFAFFFAALAAFSAIAADFADAFYFKAAIFSGEVSSLLSIAFRSRLDFCFGVAPCNGPISLKIDEKLVALDMADAGRDVDGSDVDGSEVWTSISRPILCGSKTIRRCSS